MGGVCLSTCWDATPQSRPPRSSTPPGPGTPPPRSSYPQSIQPPTPQAVHDWEHTGNKRAVRILLECILVCFIDCNLIEKSYCPTLRESDTQLIYFTLQGERIRIKNMKDLFLYSYVTDFQAWYVVENQVSVSVPFILQKYFLFLLKYTHSLL